MARRWSSWRMMLVFLLPAAIVAAVYLHSAKIAGSESDTAPPIEPLPPQNASEPSDSEPPEQEENDAYDYSRPVPAAEAPLTEDYFTDAVFIGDSRTRGFQTLSGPAAARYFTATGLKVDTVFTKEVIDAADNRKITVAEALRETSFKKAYIMLGINELGWVYSELFIDAYRDVIAAVRETEPAALIYIQSIIPVSAEKARKDPVYNNEKIREYNELLQRLATEEKVYYLDVAGHLAESDGCLPTEASTDGIHLNKKYCDLWRDYLFNHYVAEPQAKGVETADAQNFVFSLAACGSGFLWLRAKTTGGYCT